MKNYEKTIFFYITYKAASTSLRELFGEHCGYIDINHRRMFIPLINRCPNSYFVFTVLRNPLDKFVSGYLWLSGSEHPHFETTRTRTRKLGMKWQDIVDDRERLAVFISEISERRYIEHRHIKHIERQVFDRPNRIDFYILFDNLQKDTAYMCEHLRLPINCNKLSQIIIYPTRSAPKKEIYGFLRKSPGLTKLINNIYDHDWILYNRIVRERKERGYNI